MNPLVTTAVSLAHFLPAISNSLVPPCSPLRLSFPHYTHSTRGAAGSPEGASRPGGRYAVYGG